MQYLSLLVLLCFFSNDLRAQLSFECECNYNSSFDEKFFISTIDSVVNKVRGNKNEDVQVIGMRGFAAASFVVIVNRNNVIKAHAYSLTKKRFKVVTGEQIKLWSQGMIRDSSLIYTAWANPHARPSHTHAYFVSLRYPSVPLKEICHWVLWKNIDRPFAVCLSSLMFYFGELGMW